jgi:hypothetical protein
MPDSMFPSAPAWMPRARHGVRMRAFVLGLALTLALFVVAAAGHRHERTLETHVCAVCTVLMNELPSGDALPPVVQVRAAHAYALAPSVPAYRCPYRHPVRKPPSCGPPA